VSIKKEFLSISECYFLGHSIKFLEWTHNFKIDLLDCFLPSWFVLPSLPPELCHEDIIKSIGSEVGEVRGIDASFYCCNDVKVLINVKLNRPLEFTKKLLPAKQPMILNFRNIKGK